MKHYNIRLGVPDDFNPDELNLNVEYKDDVLLEGEGFLDIKEILEENYDKFTINQIKSNRSDVVVFQFPPEFAEANPLLPQQIMELLEDKLGCTAIGIVNDMDLLVQSSSESIEMLKKMINKINSKALIKLV